MKQSVLKVFADSEESRWISALGDFTRARSIRPTCCCTLAQRIFLCNHWFSYIRRLIENLLIFSSSLMAKEALMLLTKFPRKHGAVFRCVTLETRMRHIIIVFCIGLKAESNNAVTPVNINRSDPYFLPDTGRLKSRFTPFVTQRRSESNTMAIRRGGKCGLIEAC